MPTSPLYRRIAAELREDILNGQLKPGEQLPTEQDLCARYEVSRNTVRLALGALTNEGLTASARGRGHYVRERATFTYYASRSELADRPASERQDAYFSEVREQGREPSQKFEMRLISASVEIAERLRIEEGEAAVLRRIYRYLDGQPWSVQDSYYPMDLAEGTEIMSPRNIDRGIIRVLAEQGHEEIGRIDEVTARMPTPDETHILELDPGVPVLRFARTTYTTSRPVRLTITVFPADRNRLVFEQGDLRAYYEPPEPA
ncbi:MAG: GntR family transcriptional regulator [Nocardioidaceae bacterium]